MLIQFVIMFQQKNDVPKNGSSTHGVTLTRPITNILFSEIPAINLKKALVNVEPGMDALGELIMTGQAAFAFIRYSELDLPLRNAMNQLEKQFEFYRRLLGR
jgi:hypothetical protein